MKFKNALLIGALVIISALLIKPYNISGSTVSIPSEYSYISDINNFYVFDGSSPKQSVDLFTYGSFRGSYQGSSFDIYPISPLNTHTYKFNGNAQYWHAPNWTISNNNSTAYCEVLDGILDIHITVNQDTSCDVTYSKTSNDFILLGQLMDITQGSISNYKVLNIGYGHNPDAVYMSSNNGGFYWTGSHYSNLSDCLTDLYNNWVNVNIYVDDVLWVSSNNIYYDIMQEQKGLRVNGSDYSWYVNYNTNKFTISYNYDLIGRDNGDNTQVLAVLGADDILTFETYMKVPSKSWLENWILQQGLEDSPPNTVLQYAKAVKDHTGLLHDSSIPSVTIKGLNFYGNQEDAVVYDDSFLSANLQSGMGQSAGTLIFQVTSDNNSASSPNLLARLVSYYGSERLAILGSAFGYIDYCRSYCLNKSGNNWNVYNPYYTYWYQAGEIRSGSFRGTPQNFTQEQVEQGEDIGDVYSPADDDNATQNSYTGGITNIYNNTYNNYNSYTQTNQELLDYLYRYRDGGQQEDIENAYGYLNSTIDSVSNVPVLLGKLFTSFFPTPVILLFNAMFIIFAVFIIIKIIRHLFL